MTRIEQLTKFARDRGHSSVSDLGGKTLLTLSIWCDFEEGGEETPLIQRVALLKAIKEEVSAALDAAEREEVS